MEYKCFREMFLISNQFKDTLIVVTLSLHFPNSNNHNKVVIIKQSYSDPIGLLPLLIHVNG